MRLLENIFTMVRKLYVVAYVYSKLVNFNVFSCYHCHFWHSYGQVGQPAFILIKSFFKWWFVFCFGVWLFFFLNFQLFRLKKNSSKEPVLSLLSEALLLSCISHNSSFYKVANETV